MTLTIKNDRALLDGVPVAYQATPNHGGALAPQGIILHDTAGDLEGGGSVTWLCSPQAHASAHVVVKRDGRITQLAPFDVQTWHAGQSYWKGRSNVNGFAVGIEIVNPGKLVKRGSGYVNDIGVAVPGAADVRWRETREHGAGYWLAYTDAQVAAVTDLCKALVAAYPSIAWIATHYLISPGRKIDVGPQFPLEEVRRAVLPGSPALNAPTPAGADVRTYQMKLIALGYDLGPAGADGDAGPKTQAAVKAFQAAHGLEADGIVGPATRDALDAALAAATAKTSADLAKKPAPPPPKPAPAAPKPSVKPSDAVAPAGAGAAAAAGAHQAGLPIWAVVLVGLGVAVAAFLIVHIRR